MTSIDLLGPVVYRDRACHGVDQDVFFPNGSEPKDIRRAQEICGRCPRLAECAAWAAPLVRSGALTDCVVATVKAPAAHSNSDRRRRRDAAADQLEAVAAYAATAAQAKGAA
ncbi:WhiB family transcriptional regulator [Nocardia sp. CY41]|uniref:WhiB family transcriptional regulator n=1 Tax=Nocardia sp. CY41 TaxID=2608686 RepID=UPI001F2EDF06|nr:WhiB family transcriptional regulator [Nocardia sp. CY41]